MNWGHAKVIEEQANTWVETIPCFSACGESENPRGDTNLVF